MSPEPGIGGRESLTDDRTALDLEVAAHDAAVAALGLSLWVGNEPTFTDRFSQATESLTGAVGEDKRQRAARCVWRRLGAEAVPPALPVPAGASGGFTLDLRYATRCTDR